MLVTTNIYCTEYGSFGTKLHMPDAQNVRKNALNPIILVGIF